ncbi:MAG TPA: glycosyltransferase family 4 protein [Actinomycetota bacterium]|nr:glycosyltransferase family 4 protein [Actinomycetota bacterium]
MRIALLSPPWIPVPPQGYGGIEWVVSLLGEELVARGHDVTLIATGDSKSSANLRYVFDQGPTELMHHALPYAMHVGDAFLHFREEEEAGRPYDIIHDHTAWLALAFAPLLRTPFVHTLHGAALESERAFFRQVRSHATFVSVSKYQTTTFTEIDISAVVPNAVDVDSYPLRRSKDDYLLCLGRIARDKAQGLAIEAAKRVGVPLVLAGKVDPGDDRAYFDEAILPHIDGELIRFEGEVPDERKRELFASARGFLFPIQWDEPFGLVMLEAMACGTPVIAMPRGAAPEVVIDGENGYLVNSVDEMVDAIHKLDNISPDRARETVNERFSTTVMTDGYLRVYEQIARARRA